MGTKEITEIQLKTLRFIKTFLDENGYPPSVREIGHEFGIHERAAYDRILAIEKKGYISRKEKTSRGIKIIRDF